MVERSGLFAMCQRFDTADIATVTAALAMAWRDDARVTSHLPRALLKWFLDCSNDQMDVFKLEQRVGLRPWGAPEESMPCNIWMNDNSVCQEKTPDSESTLCAQHRYIRVPFNSGSAPDLQKRSCIIS